MSTGRSSLAAVAINVATGAGPSLLATGGRGLNSCESFELTRWRWRQGPSMALGRESDFGFIADSQGKEIVPKSKQKLWNWWREPERESFMVGVFLIISFTLRNERYTSRFSFMKRDWKPKLLAFRSLSCVWHLHAVYVVSLQVCGTSGYVNFFVLLLRLLC